MHYTAGMFTSSQAAKKLGLTAARIRQLCGEQRMIAERLGRDWVIHSLVIAPPAIPRGRPRKEAA